MFNKLKIEEIIENKIPHQKGVHLSGFKDKKFNSYLIHTNNLLLNPYNDRFAMQRSENKILNIEQSENTLLSNSVQEEIAKTIWSINEKWNRNTKNDILNHGVLKPIVIDYSGIIIDGNRRVLISKKILDNSKLQHSDIDRLSYIECIVIPKKLSRDEIHKYETLLQISEDTKLEYDPINLYLKVNDLLLKNKKFKDHKYKIVEKLMGSKYKERDIRERESTFKIMRDYLKEINKDGVFTCLKKREDLFKHYGKFRAGIKENKIKSNHINYEDIDIQKRIKKISYSLILDQYEGKAFRDLYSTEKIKQGPFTSIPSIEYLENAFFESSDNLNSFIYESKDRETIKKIVKTATDIANSCINKKEIDVEKIIDDIDKKIKKLHNEFSKNRNIIHNKFENNIKNIKNKINEILNAIHKDRY